jgi:hypothetical protein
VYVDEQLKVETVVAALEVLALELVDVWDVDWAAVLDCELDALVVDDVAELEVDGSVVVPVWVLEEPVVDGEGLPENAK